MANRKSSPEEEPGRELVQTIPGFDVIELTGHAAEQMTIRGLTDDDVLKTLQDPTITGLPTQEGRKRVRRNKTIRIAVDVVYEEIGKRLRVITVIKVTRRLIERRKP